MLRCQALRADRWLWSCCVVVPLDYFVAFGSLVVSPLDSVLFTFAWSSRLLLSLGARLPLALLIVVRCGFLVITVLLLSDCPACPGCSQSCGLAVGLCSLPCLLPMVGMLLMCSQLSLGSCFSWSSSSRGVVFMFGFSLLSFGILLWRLMASLVRLRLWGSQRYWRTP